MKIYIEEKAILENSEGKEIMTIAYKPGKKMFIDTGYIAILKTEQLKKKIESYENKYQIKAEKVKEINKIEGYYLFKSLTFQAFLDFNVDEEKTSFDYYILPQHPIFCINNTENDEWSMMISSITGNEEEYPPFYKEPKRRLQLPDPTNNPIDCSSDEIAKQVFTITENYTITKKSDIFYQFHPIKAKPFACSLDLFLMDDYLVISGPDLHAIALHYYKGSYKFLKLTGSVAHFSGKVVTDKAVREYSEEKTRNHLRSYILSEDNEYSKYNKNYWLKKIEKSDFSNQWKAYQFLLDNWEELPFKLTYNSVFEDHVLFSYEKPDCTWLFWYLKAFVYHFEKLPR